MPNHPTLEMEIQIKDPSFRDADGNLYIEAAWMQWSPLVTTDESCSHDHTACDHCIGDWASDYWIRIRAAGGPWHTLNGAPGLPPVKPI